jgi:epoxyqueuosine reductase QueG
MGNCNSVIVFAFNVGLDYYTSFEYFAGGDTDFRILYLYRDYVELRLADFLRRRGYDTGVMPRKYVDDRRKIAALSYKLAAYEAGIGVFGRCGLIITPEYGPRVNLGVVLTEAPFEPDGRMKNFNPCLDCNVCVKSCPVGCIDGDLPPPEGFNRDKCLQFIYWLREVTNRKIMHCGYCFNSCPAGDFIEKTIRISRWETLYDTNIKLREKLVRKFQCEHKPTM